jgi:hypothetical protein
MYSPAELNLLHQQASKKLRISAVGVDKKLRRLSTVGSQELLAKAMERVTRWVALRHICRDLRQTITQWLFSTFHLLPCRELPFIVRVSDRSKIRDGKKAL